MHVIVSLGTNIGNRQAHIDAMIEECASLFHPPIRYSQLMETEPVGTPDSQQWYYNLIVSGTYHDTVYHLLKQTQKIEKSMGRKGKKTKRARTADIDILLADMCIINEPDLIIPHPRILDRRFCIEGISQIAPFRVHPVTNRTFEELKNAMASHISEQKINFIGI